MAQDLSGSASAVVFVLFDSIECDGSFLLHGMVSRVLDGVAAGKHHQSMPQHPERIVEDWMMACGVHPPRRSHAGNNNNNNGARHHYVAWISCCGIDTDTTSWFTSRKQTSSLSPAGKDTRCNLYDLPQLLADAVRKQAAEEKTLVTSSGTAPDSKTSDKEALPLEYRVVRQLYQQILQDAAETASQKNMLVIMDDLGTLEVLVGEKLASALVLQMVSWVRRQKPKHGVGDATVSTRLFLRQSMDVELEAFLGQGGEDDDEADISKRPTAATTAQTRDVAMVIPSWIGAGSAASSARASESPLSLELADVVVDVVPHASSAFSSSLGGATGVGGSAGGTSLGKVIVTDRRYPNNSWQRPI